MRIHLCKRPKSLSVFGVEFPPFHLVKHIKVQHIENLL